MWLIKNPEVLRRLALALGLFLSIVMCFNAVTHLYQVEIPDFKQLQRWRLTNPLRIQGPLQDYIDYRVKGLTKEVSGPQWQELFDKFAMQQKGKTPQEWLHNRSTANKRGYRELYFAPDTEPYTSLVDQEHSDKYLVLKGEEQTRYLLIRYWPPKRADHAPDSLLFPWRHLSWLPLLIGLLLYLFVLPKVRRPKGSLGFARLYGVMVTDFFGLFFAGLFFVFGFLALTSNNGNLATLFSMDSGPQSLVLIMFFLGIVGLAPMWFGISLRNFWIELPPQGLVRHTLKGSRLYAYGDMKEASLGVRKPHWLASLILAFGGRDPATAAMAMSAASRPDNGILIQMKDGRSWWIRLQGFDSGEALARALQKGGAKLNSLLREALDGFDQDGQ